MNAIHAMSADPYQSQTLQNMSKMRKQMVTKMHDCQAKLEKQKKNVMSLYAQKAEYEQRLDIPVQGCTQMNNRTHTHEVSTSTRTPVTDAVLQIPGVVYSRYCSPLPHDIR